MQAAGQEIDVLGLVVGGVTATAGVKTPSTFFTPSATTMARAALQKVGCGKAEVVGYWAHAVQIYLLGLLPDEVLTPLKVRIMKNRRLGEAKSQ